MASRSPPTTGPVYAAGASAVYSIGTAAPLGTSDIIRTVIHLALSMELAAAVLVRIVLSPIAKRFVLLTR